MRPLLMIPGPIEVSPAVREAYSIPPASHLAPNVIEAFGRSIELLREVCQASPDSQPFVVPGSGTTAMDMAVANLVREGDRVVVVNSGYFSDRIAEMLRRLGAEVVEVGAEPGQAPPLESVRAAVQPAPLRALVATHVDTSTAVRVDPEPLARLAREAGALSIFDGVCATAAEVFRMEEWGADVYLTASQKAIGLPPGLGLLVASPRALAARDALPSPPPMALDWHQWLPIHRAYEARRGAYFATPNTNLVLALAVGLEEILEQGMEARFDAHRRAAEGLRAAWKSAGLRLVPSEPLAANTLSGLYAPEGIEAGALVAAIKARGVVVAGGLHPAIRGRYFRVGHMGWSVSQPELLLRTVDAVVGALGDLGRNADPKAAREAFLAATGVSSGAAG